MTGKKLPQIVLFGDSLTEWAFEEYNKGFGWVLENKYAGKAEIVNEGQAGYTSSMLKRNFQDIITRATHPSAAPTRLLTIFLGANDACLIPNHGEYVPLPTFEANIRQFVTTILNEPKLSTTKIVLITPPPINIPDPVEDFDVGPVGTRAAREIDPKTDRGYLTYMSKKRFADKITEIAGSYEEQGEGERVIGLDFWKKLVDAGLEDQHRLGDEDQYAEERLPGCGLKWAKAFRDGYFTDGLHFGPLAYEILSRELLNAVLTKWPELAPEKIEA